MNSYYSVNPLETAFCTYKRIYFENFGNKTVSREEIKHKIDELSKINNQSAEKKVTKLKRLLSFMTTFNMTSGTFADEFDSEKNDEQKSTHKINNPNSSIS